MPLFGGGGKSKKGTSTNESSPSSSSHNFLSSSSKENSTRNHDQQQQQQQHNSIRSENDHDHQQEKKRHLPDITKVQVTSRDPLSPKELRQDLQRLVQQAMQTKVMTHTIDTIVTTATSVSRQQDLFRLLCRGEERELVAVLGATDNDNNKKPTTSSHQEPSQDNVRLWSSILVAFVATEAHSKLAASYLGVSKQHSIAASVAELETELEWFFARYDPRHTHFAKTIASHFHNNIAMQTGLARFLFQDLLWVVLGISKEQDVHFPYLQTVEAALGLGTVEKLHESYMKIVVWNKERNEQVRKQAQETAISGVSSSSSTAKKTKDDEEEDENDDNKQINEEPEERKPDDSSAEAMKPSAEAEDGEQRSQSDKKNDSLQKYDEPGEKNTTTNNNNNNNNTNNTKLLWSPQATAAIILVAEFALRPQKHVASAIYASIPPLYRDSFSWVAHPWLEIPLDFKQFPKPFILYDLWALDTIHRFTEFRQFCIDQLQSFFLEESGAFNVIEDARRSSEQVLRRKAGIQYIVVRRALEMLVKTESEHRASLEGKRSNFLQEAKMSMIYAGDYRAMRLQNMFNPVNPAFHGKFHAMKLVIEENAREIQRIGRAVGEKQRLQAEAAQRQEQMMQFAGRSHHTSATSNNKNSNNSGIVLTQSEKASNFLKSSNAMKRIIADEKQHRRHLLHTLSDMDEQERELTNRLKRHSHLVDVSELMPLVEEEQNDENEDDDGTDHHQQHHKKRLGVSPASPLSPAQLLRSGYTERDAERHHHHHHQHEPAVSPSPAPSPSSPSSYHHLLHGRSSSASLSRRSPRQPRNHYLHQRENEKKVVIDDDDLQKILYSHHYHVNAASSSLDEYEAKLRNEQQALKKKMMNHEDEAGDKTTITNPNTSEALEESQHQLSSPSASFRGRKAGALSTSGISAIISSSPTTQQRSQIERQKILKTQQRAVTPTFWNTEAKSRVAHVGTPRNNESIRTGAIGRQRDASQAIINSSYKYRAKFNDASSSSASSSRQLPQNRQRQRHIDPKTMTNDELAAAMEGDGRLRLDTLKKTEDFKKLKGQFYHMMYGRLFEAMGGEF